MRASRDEVIAQIYAAAVEPDGVSRIANLLRGYVDVDSVGLWFIDKGEISDLYQSEDIIESVGPYLAYYQRLDPWIASQKTPGQVYLSRDTVDERTLVRSEFYQDFARHYGMLRPMGLVLPLEGGRLATFALNRMSPDRLLDEPERAIVQDIAVHLRAALSLRARHLAALAQAEARAAVLNSAAFGVVLCGADGTIRDANHAAIELSAEHGCFGPMTSGSQLVARAIPEAAALRSLIAAAAKGEPGAMRLRGKRGAVSVLVTPTLSRLDARGRPVDSATVYIQSDDAAPGVDAATLARLFGLSPAQANLCVLLLTGLTFEEAAAERNIATSTARSHFAAILERTGARNLRDLLRLLGSLPSLRR